DEDRRSRSRRRAPPAGVRAVAREARRAGGAPLQAPGRRRGRGEASRGVPRQASGRRPDGGGAAGLPRWQAPELHGAFGVRQPADPPADRRGQARSCGDAGTRAFPPPPRRDVRRAADAARGGPGGDLVGVSGPRRGRGVRQLLRSLWRFHPQLADQRPGPRRGDRARSPRPLRAPDARRDGRPDRRRGGAALAMASKNVEDVYPLSPIQEGMLFHALYEPGAGIYVSQIACVFEGLRAAAFVESWQQVVDRHTALRTAFVWKTTERPLQVVAKRVTLAWTEEDWRHLDPGERRRGIDEYLERDRLQEFQLARAPLMGLSLLRTGEERYQFVWTHHHLLIDGWSVSLVMREVLTIYAARLSGGEARLDRARPYRAYIEWLQRQDMAAAESFWRSSLAGFTTPTPLVDDGGSGHPGAGHGQVRLQLPAAATAAIHTFARQQGLTLNTLLQGAWALLLARSGGQQDVVFGAVNSGRPPELRGIEGIVGVFINTLPVRVKVGEESFLLDWLRRLQDEQAEA